MKKFTINFTESRKAVMVEADTFEYIPNGVIFKKGENYESVGAVYNSSNGEITEITSK